MVDRAAIVASDSVCYVSTGSAWGRPAFDSAEDRERFLWHLEAVRAAFQARLYAYALEPHAVHLVIEVREPRGESDSVLRARWRRLAPRTVPPASRLRTRFGSLGGFMQTLLQRVSREHNQRHRQRGRLWAGRYKAALLADDCAVLAATAWLEGRLEPQVSGSRETRGAARAPVTLAMPPLRIGPDDFIFPADEAPPGTAPPAGSDVAPCLARFAAGLTPDASEAYGRALATGWALGRPESLASVLSRLARPSGRGRTRRLRELDDDLGLCGVWG